MSLVEDLKRLWNKLNLAEKGVFIEQCLKEKGLYETFKRLGLDSSGSQISIDDVQSRSRTRPEDILSKAEKLDVIDLVKEITTIGTISKINPQGSYNVFIDYISWLDRIGIISTINQVDLVSNIGTISKLQTLDLIDQITQISNILNVESIDLIDQISLIDNITNIGTIASLEELKAIIPRLCSLAQSAGWVNVPNQTATSVISINGAGNLIQAKLEFQTVVAPTSTIVYRVDIYADGNLSAFWSNRDLTQSETATSGRSSCGEFYQASSRTYLNVRMPIEFRTSLVLKAYQSTGSAINCMGTIFANLNV